MTRGPSLAMRIGRLGADCRGVTAIEFGILTPVMVMFMMGMGDVLHGTYTNAVLLGAVQKAGRDATIQMADVSAGTTAIDNKVMAQVRKVAPSATFVSARENYTNFSDVDKPEPFTDKAGGTTGKYDPGECYSDTNGNKQWDADGARSGVGGASDVSQYTITITYPRLFPTGVMLGLGKTASLTAQTMLKNQPYAAQSSSTAATICT